VGQNSMQIRGASGSIFGANQHRMLTAGEDIAAISVEMGHENVGITAQFYAGFLRELKSKKFGDKAIVEYGQGPVE